jgi:Sigma-70 region 2
MPPSFDADDEASLLRRARATSAEERGAAQHRVFELFRERVFALCLHTLGNQADAQDAVQDTFVSVFGRSNGFAASRDCRRGSIASRCAKRFATSHVDGRASRSTTRCPAPTVVIPRFAASNASDCLARLIAFRPSTVLCSRYSRSMGYHTARSPTCSASRKGRSGRASTVRANDLPQSWRPSCGRSVQRATFSSAARASSVVVRWMKSRNARTRAGGKWRDG